MSKMKSLQELPWRWILVVTTGMAVHVSKTCVLGFCQDKLIDAFTPTLSSSIYTFTVCSLLSRYQLNPEILQRTCNARILLILDALWTLLIANIALRMIWIPQVINVADVLDKAAKFMDSNSITKNILETLSEYISFENAVEITNLMLALAWFGIYLYAVDGVSKIKKLFKKSAHSKWPKCCCKVSFDDPIDDGGLKPRLDDYWTT